MLIEGILVFVQQKPMSRKWNKRFIIYHTFFQATFSKDIARDSSDRQRPFTHYSMDTLHPTYILKQKKKKKKKSIKRLASLFTICLMISLKRGRVE